MKGEKYLRHGWIMFLFAALFLVACSNSTNASSTATSVMTRPPITTEAVTATSVMTRPPIATEAVTATTELAQETNEDASESGGCVAPTVAYPAPPITSEIPTYSYKVINSYPHDPNAFTQGLVWEEGMFYEGTGFYGSSSLRHVQAESGDVQQTVPLDPAYFGEGIVVWGDRIIQITWKSEIAFVYNKTNFAQIGEFRYEGEGWGITQDGRCLIMSNGSNTITFRDPETFAEVGHLQVYDNNGPVGQLNELEYIDGEIYANVWQTNRIARINPQTGQLVGWIDLSNLLDTSTLIQPVSDLNGIAYDAGNGRLFVTGKLWPTLFEIELIQQ